MPSIRVTHPAALTITCLLIVGCGGGSSREPSTRDGSAPGGDVTRAPAARVTPDPLSESADEPIVRIGKLTITGGVLRHWTSVGVRGKIGAPEPPRFAACVDYLGSARNNRATIEQLTLVCKRKYEEVVRKALNLLIHARWLIGEAAATGVRVDEARLKRETALSGPRGEEVRQMLTNKGENLSDLRLTLMLTHLSAQFERKLERRAPALAEAQIAGFYKRHKASFVIPEQRDLNVVRLGNLGEANRAKREIEHGTSFATIAGRTSLVQPTGAHGGLLYGLKPENWPEKPLPEEIFHAPLKTLRGPVRISFGYFVFEVVRRTPPRPRTLAEAKPEVAEQLRQLQRQRIASRFVAGFTRKWAPQTVCLPSHLASYCRELRSSPATPQEVPNLLF